MDLEIREFSAYHGKNWRNRNSSHQEEVLSRQVWKNSIGYNSEYLPLKEVVLFEPDTHYPEVTNPEDWQFLRHVNRDQLRSEFTSLKQTYESLGINVHTLKDHHFPHPSPNLVFCRDLFFLTPFGAIVGRMGSVVRAGEEKWAQLALAQQGVPILISITGNGLFEGADALWLDSQTVLVGIGNRTNEEAFLQMQTCLQRFGIQCIKITLPKSVQHLLGLLQITSRGTALVRKNQAPQMLIDTLKSRSYEVLLLEDSEEIVWRQAFNFVCYQPNHIVMAKNCPETRKKLEQSGLIVAAEVEISQYINAAGGIACATGILSRELRF